MKRKIWKHVLVGFAVTALLATVAGGDASAGKARGVGRTVDGSEVVDNSLTGSDIVETSLDYPVTFGVSQSTTIGYPAIKTGLVSSACPDGTKAISGTVSWDNDQDDDDVYIRESGFTGPNSWYAIGVDGPVNNHPVTLRVTAICLG
jgi:hypothetical protein